MQGGGAGSGELRHTTAGCGPQAYKELKWFETAYVVRMHAATLLAAPLPVFTFVHPNTAATIDNRRYARLRWRAHDDGVVHGFAGYFDARLYGDVHISIHPATHSPGMFSWFPLYFPLRVRPPPLASVTAASPAHRAPPRRTR